MKPKERLWTPEEVASYLQVNKFTVYRLIAKKELPASKVGMQWRVKPELLEAWLESHSNRQNPIKRRRRKK